MPTGWGGEPGIGPASPYEPRLSVRGPALSNMVITIPEATEHGGFELFGPSHRPGETAAAVTSESGTRRCQFCPPTRGLADNERRRG